MRRRSEPQPIQLRIGASCLGLFLGLLLGFVAAVACVAFGLFRHIPFAGWVFGGAFGTALASFAYPKIAFVLLPAAGQLIAGFGAASTSQDNASLLQPDHTTPTWLKVTFSVGAVLALVIGVASALFM